MTLGQMGSYCPDCGLSQHAIKGCAGRISYNQPIWYRDYRIYFADDGPYTYAFQHDDYDGADDACDNRAGYANTVEEAKAEIDEREDEGC